MPDNHRNSSTITGENNEPEADHLARGWWRRRAHNAEDKAAQWDAAQPMIEAMTELVESVRRMTRDGHPCGPTGGDDWFKIMMRRLAAIDGLLPQQLPKEEQ